MTKRLKPQQGNMSGQKAAKDIDEAKIANDKRLRSAMRKVFASEEGLIVLNWIMGECGYQSPNSVANRQTGELFDKSTDYNESRRILYLRLRGYLTPNILIPVEIEGLTSTKKPITKKRKAA